MVSRSKLWRRRKLPPIYLWKAVILILISILSTGKKVCSGTALIKSLSMAHMRFETRVTKIRTWPSLWTFPQRKQYTTTSSSRLTILLSLLRTKRTVRLVSSKSRREKLRLSRWDTSRRVWMTGVTVLLIAVSQASRMGGNIRRTSRKWKIFR